MGSLTVRNIGDDVKKRLRMRAARHGRSMEEEVRHILAAADGGAPDPEIGADLSRPGKPNMPIPARTGHGPPNQPDITSIVEAWRNAAPATRRILLIIGG
jgi:hypothetical protein